MTFTRQSRMQSAAGAVFPELSQFALARHGFGNSDGGFGITYPSDLDDYDREVEGVAIPVGFVQVYGFWGPPDGYEFNIREFYYLAELIRILRNQGFESEAKGLEAFQNTLSAI